MKRETFSDNINSIDEKEIGNSSIANEMNQQVSVPSNSKQCPQCDAVFTHRGRMLEHVRSKHEGVRYPCSQCDYKATKPSNLKRHVKGFHEGM